MHEKAEGWHTGPKGRLKNQAWNLQEPDSSGAGLCLWQDYSGLDSARITAFSLLITVLVIPVQGQLIAESSWGQVPVLR